MSQPNIHNYINKKACITLRTSLTKISKITEQSVPDAIGKDEIEDLKFQLIKNAETSF